MNRRQTIPKHLRYTFKDFNRQFPDDDACLEHIKEQRFPGGMAHCEKCGVTEASPYRWSPCIRLRLLRKQIYPLAGTIFEKSTTSLRIWFYAMYLMCSTRCGISAKQIQRETGVTYKTAWRMFRQIRYVDVRTGHATGGRTVEMDETYTAANAKAIAEGPEAEIKRSLPLWASWNAEEAKVASLLRPLRMSPLIPSLEWLRNTFSEPAQFFTDDFLWLR